LELLLIIGAIIWILASSAEKRKRKQRQRAEVFQKAAEAASSHNSGAPKPNIQPTVRPTVIPRSGHVVTPSRDTNHAHQETSMIGEQPCPKNPVADAKPLSERLAAYKAAKAALDREKHGNVPDPVENTASTYAEDALITNLQFDGKSVRNGLLYAEILGKPKALRRR